MSRKVVIVIVEGPTDEDTLVVLNKIMPERFYFHVVRGDIITDKNIDGFNVIKELNKKVNAIKSELKRVEKLKESDFLGIIQVTDTDGAFLPSENIILDETLKHIRYISEPPCIRASNPELIKDRNFRKSEVLKKLFLLDRVSNLPYSIFYCSCNLEHLFHGRLNCRTKEKVELAEELASKFDEDEHLFFRIIEQKDIAVGENYIESWKYLEKNGTESIQRHTNLHLVQKTVDRMRKKREKIS